MTPRSLAELTEPEPIWPEVEQLVTDSPTSVTVLPVRSETEREVTLVELNVSVGSVLGAITWNTGAIIIDDGWLTVLGAGTETIPVASIRQFSLGGKKAKKSFDGVFFAYDVIGGLFAIHGKGLKAKPGEVCFWSPSTLNWTPLGMAHSEFIALALTGGLAEMYAPFRWEGWREAVKSIEPGNALFLYPPLFSDQGRNPAASTQTVVPIAELMAFEFDNSPKFGAR